MQNSKIVLSWDFDKLELKNLTLEQVKQIDEYLSSVGDYGEIDLVVQNGELRYINRIVSFKASSSAEHKAG